ncbi:MAG: DUF5017 domain-containing protein [Bacteroidetes bacterium]|jgi:hypothetical protein|nr:DUF5017 domain-containing protein [Bacteroidota bacterium]
MKHIQIPILLLAMVSLFSVASCVQEDFDTPEIPEEEVPDIETNATLADIVDLWQEGTFVTIEEDLVVSAVVIADDFSGNYFRSIVIQDDEGTGITFLLNARDLHNDYPIGRRIYIEAKDLVVGDFNGLIQLGGSVFINDDGFEQMGGIEESLLDKYITKGQREQFISPKTVSINELGFQDLSTLVEIDDIQVVESELGLPFADAENLRSENRTLEDCDGNPLVLRSSGFADFADETLPGGKGKIVGVYSVFGTTKQLFIRDLNDVDMGGERCDGSGGGDCNFDGNPEPIEDIRNRFTGSASNLPNDLFIEGTVISDRSSGNINNQNMFVQDDNGYGILVRFSSEHSFSLNDRVKVDVSGQELSEFNGLLQVNNVPLSRACKDGSGSITPRVLTLEQILADFENLESTLVQVDNVQISKSDGDDWIFSVQLNDGTAQMDLFTSPGANFANDNFPTDTLRITAVVSQGGDQEAQQLSLRNLDDVVVVGTGGGDPTDGINVDFQSGQDRDEISLSGWTNQATVGDRRWIYRSFDQNLFAQMTSFNAGAPSNESWLVTPEINTSETPMLSFESAQAFYKHDGLSVWVSTNFSGDVSSASWEEVTEATLAGSSDEEYDWIESGEIDLSSYGSQVYIGFKYEGTSETNTTTYRLDNIVVE